MDEPTKLLWQYETGRITWSELLIRLCQAASEQSPEQLAAKLPPKVLAELRERLSAPLDVLDKQRLTYSGSFVGPGESWDQHLQKETSRMREGQRNWRQYFEIP